MSDRQFAKPSEYGGGTFFKPAEHMHDLAILIEPKRIDRGIPNTYQGRVTMRDEVTADVAIFPTSESLERGTPTVIKNARFVHGMLTSTLEKILGGALVGVVRKVPTQAGSGYAFRDVDPAIESMVGAYYTNRETAVAAAMADVPDFD